MTGESVPVAEPEPSGRRPGTGRRPNPLALLRSSLLLKILAGLVVAVVGSSTVTALLETRLTRDALDEQSGRIADGNLRVLKQAFAARERNLVVDLRNLEERINGLELALDDRVTLVNELSGVYRTLELDALEVVDTEGRPLDPPVRAPGVELTADATLTAQQERAVASRLVRTGDGQWLQTVIVPIRVGDTSYRLVGGHAFDDEYAFRLRGALGTLGHVVLVVEGRVVGTTLIDQPAGPPGLDREGAPLPIEPVARRIGGDDVLVAYTLVRRASSVGAALGVLLDDPGVPVDRDLAEARLLAGAVLGVLSLLVGWLFFRALVRPLVALKDTAGRIAAGDLDASFEAVGSDEVADLARSLERMRRELRAQLDVIAEQATALQDSSQRIVAAQDEERHRLARDLHDGIQQQLIVLRMGFGLAKEAAERDPATKARSLAELGTELDSAIQRLREVSHDLYPSILVDRGLAAALRTSMGRLPVPAGLATSPDPLPRLPPEVESSAYFLVGEAVANALKHAGAREISIGLEAGDDVLRVVVRDDGRGFDTAGSRHRGGLLHMDDRARSFGGTLRIRSGPGAGTVVEATFPLRRAAEVTPTG